MTLYYDEINEFIETIENEFVETEILNGTFENNICIKSDLTVGLFIEILNDEYNINIDYEDIIEYIRVKKFEYIYIIKLQYDLERNMNKNYEEFIECIEF